MNVKVSILSWMPRLKSDQNGIEIRKLEKISSGHLG